MATDDQLADYVTGLITQLMQLVQTVRASGHRGDITVRLTIPTTGPVTSEVLEANFIPTTADVEVPPS